MIRPCLAVAVLLYSLALWPAQAATPPEALAIDRYLAGSPDHQNGCAANAFSMHIDASLPSLKKRASMSGFKLVSRTGRILYRDLGFTGDNLVVTEVIARFLAHDRDQGKHGTEMALTRQNYSITYLRPSDYHGRTAYVYHLKPKQRRVGLFKGELWLDAAGATPLRLWGESVKSPSIFIRYIRFVDDYSIDGPCVQPLRLLVTVQTRIAGEADLIVWMRPLDANDPDATIPADDDDITSTVDNIRVGR
jgi:hypothetical protein